MFDICLWNQHTDLPASDLPNCPNEEIRWCISILVTKAIIAKFVIIYMNNIIHLAYDDVIETITYEPLAYEIHANVLHPVDRSVDQ
jgi:hypothetical protein